MVKQIFHGSRQAGFVASGFFNGKDEKNLLLSTYKRCLPTFIARLLTSLSSVSKSAVRIYSFWNVGVDQECIYMHYDVQHFEALQSVNHVDSFFI